MPLVHFDELLYRLRRVRTSKTIAVKAPTGKDRQGWRSRRVAQVLIVAVCLVVIADGLVGERGLLAMLRARQQYDELAAAIAQKRAENARLREHARRLREDPSAIEEIARRELGLIKPGETVFIIKDVAPEDPK
jgi:cell division protein FtsB